MTGIKCDCSSLFGNKTGLPAIDREKNERIIFSFSLDRVDRQKRICLRESLKSTFSSSNSNNGGNIELSHDLFPRNDASMIFKLCHKQKIGIEHVLF